jgi:hypothetical protein
MSVQQTWTLFIPVPPLKSQDNPILVPLYTCLVSDLLPIAMVTMLECMVAMGCVMLASTLGLIMSHITLVSGHY